MTRTTGERAPVRVCYLIGSLDRCGTAIHLLAFLRHLDRTKYQPWVVGLSEPGPVGDAIRKLGIEVRQFSLRRVYSAESVRLIFRLATEIRRSRTQIVQSYLFTDNLIGPLAARWGGAAAVITGRRTVDEWESRRHLLLYRLSNPLVDRIVAVSTQVAESVYKREHVAKDKVKVIRNAQSRETLNLRADPADDAMLRELDERCAGGFVFGTVGNVRPIKGPDVLIRAFEIVVKKHPSCHLVFVGSIYPGPPEIEQMIVTRGLTDSVHLVGMRSNVAAFVERFSAFVLPSLAEGMSNALLEALLMGKPSIASRFGLPKDGDGREMVLGVPPGDVEALAVAMERVLEDKELRDSLAQNALEYAGTTMNEGQMAAAYQDLYEEVLSPRLREG